MFLAIHVASAGFAQSTSDPPPDSLSPPPSPIIDEHAEHPLSPGSDGVWWPIPLITGSGALGSSPWLDSDPLPTLLADIGLRHGHTMIFDPVRQRFLLFGGTVLPNDLFFNDVWERPLNGTGDWTPVAVSGTPPPGRWGHSAVYDPIGDRMIVFGGRTESYLGDTWELSLSGTPTWQEILPIWTPPAVRAWHTCVFDAAHNRLVVHGGRNAGFLGDVWYLDFDPLPPHWYQVTPTGTPPVARYDHVAVLDEAHGRIVMYGGIGAQYYGDVWTLTLGSSPAWTQRSILLTAGRRDAASAVLDATGNRMLVFGGRQPSSVSDQNLWSLDVSTFAWTLLTPTGSPPGIRRYAAMAIDPVSRRAILQGGLVGALNTLDDTWALTLEGGPAWTRLIPPAPQAPVISSFSPASGLVGTLVTITGANFTGASSVTFNFTASSYTVISANEMRATVPIGATSGRIRVSTLGGTATSAVDFIVTPPPPAPIIASFTPTSGSTGTVVTISGSYFTGASTVTFNFTSSSFTVVSDAEISATVPAGATSGRIRVTTPGGTGTSTVDFIVTPPPPPPPPVISSFLPASGPPGTVVTILGDNFQNTFSVMFNQSAAIFVFRSNTELSATVPLSATTGRITVTTSAGTGTSADDFTVIPPPPPPTIDSFTPTGGPVGTVVTITGSNFASASAVTFNGVGTSFTVLSGTSIQAPVPSGATTGKIRVTTAGGTAISALDFSVPPPNLGARRYGASGDFDPGRGRHVVFGGATYDPPNPAITFLNDAYTLQLGTDSSWVQIAYSGGPISGRLGPSAVFDPVRDRLLIFGGYDGNYRNDLYELRFSPSPVLQQLTIPGAPSPRDFHMAVYDALRDRMLVFGGNSNATALGDLWELTLGGTPAWHQLDAGNSTTPKRMLAGMVLDPFGDRLVLFGGWAPGSNNDLWQHPLSGYGGWTQIAATGTLPGPRHSFSFRLDPLGQRALLHSGKNEETQSLYSGTWEIPLVGPPQWRLLSSGGGSPIPRYGHQGIVDPVGNRMLVSGGFASGSPLPDVWRLQFGLDQPTPVALSFRVDAVSGDAVTLAGHVGLEGDATCRLERSPDGIAWSARAEIFPDPSGSVHFVDREVVRGEVIYYRLAVAVGGQWTRSEEIRVQVPGAGDFALHGFSPNPASGEVRVAFRLAGSAPATVELIDVSGRRVASRRIESPVFGDGTVHFAGERLSPGLYFVRLTQGTRSAVRRGIVAP